MASSDILETIKNIIASHDVVLFMKGSKESPVCGFSSAVAQILKGLRVNFFDVNVLESNEMRQGIKDYTDWPTIPQLYVKGVFIGGCDIVSQMFESGDLVSLLKEKEVL